MAEYDHFAPDYDLWAADMTEDVDWYVSLARGAVGPIVELGIGTGRIAIPIAQETGKRVVGWDRSPAMLAVGRGRAADLPIEFREGDMREFELDEPVELVICPFRALLHLPTWADRRRTFERVAAALRPGGRFASTSSRSAARWPPASTASGKSAAIRGRSRATPGPTAGSTSREVAVTSKSGRCCSGGSAARSSKG